MKINIATIPEAGLSVRFSIAGDAFADLAADRGEPAFTLQAVDVAGEIKRERQIVLFTGTLQTVVETACSRCLETAQVTINESFSNALLPETEVGKEESELQAEDMDTTYYTGEIIDLGPLIVEQVLLQIPMKALCQESCRGLCPLCGENLNSGNCGCSVDTVDPRLAVLRKFKVS